MRARLIRDQQGFTLVELMIVVVIFGILTMIALPSYLNLKSRAEDSANKANVREILASIGSYYQDNSSYSGMTLAALQTAYNRSIELSKYTLASVSATTYCIQSPQGTGVHTYRQFGPAGPIERNHC